MATGEISARIIPLLCAVVKAECGSLPPGFMDGVPTVTAMDSLVGRGVVDRLWRRAAAAVAPRPIGILVAKRVDPIRVGLAAYMARAQPTIGDVFSAYFRSLVLLQRGASRWARKSIPNGVRFEHYVLPPVVSVHDHIADFSLGVVLQLGRMCAPELRPLHVDFMHQCSERASYAAYFGGGLRFGKAAYALEFSAADMAAPNPHADAGLATLLTELAERRSATVRGGAAARVKDLLRVALIDGVSTLDQVADALGVSGRTVRRRLGAEGVTFQQCIDEVRGALAREYLADPKLSTIEVALRLGYHDTRSLYRAAQRWAEGGLAAFREGIEEAPVTGPAAGS